MWRRRKRWRRWRWKERVEGETGQNGEGEGEGGVEEETGEDGDRESKPFLTRRNSLQIIYIKKKTITYSPLNEHKTYDSTEISITTTSINVQKLKK